MYIDFDEYPSHNGRISEILENNINKNIQCVHGYEYSSGKHKMCTWVNEENWVMMKPYFPDVKKIKRCLKRFYTKNVHISKKI